MNLHIGCGLLILCVFLPLLVVGMLDPRHEWNVPRLLCLLVIFGAGLQSALELVL